MDGDVAALALAQRYAALGLRTAAAHVLVRAQADADDVPAVLAARVDVALSAGQADAARELARELMRLRPSAPARVLLGRAQLACRDLDAARLSWVAALDARDATTLVRAHAHAGLAQVAQARGDAAAVGHAREAVAALCESARCGVLDGRAVDAVAVAIALAAIDAEATAALTVAHAASTPAVAALLARALTGLRPTTDAGVGGGAADAVADTRARLSAAPMDPAALDAAIQAQLDAGDVEPAVALICRALRLDPDREAWWRDAAMVASGPGGDIRAAALVEGLAPFLGVVQVATRLVHATRDVARDDVLTGVAAHGHRVKNSIGVIAARARSARRVADGAVATRLVDLERELADLYDGWARTLRSLQLELPTIAIIEVAAWLVDVVAAARDKAADRTAALQIDVDVEPGLPTLRADRRLLGEAVGNLLDNAIEAAGDRAARISIRAGAEAGKLRVAIIDDGPGLGAAELARLVAAGPGYTSKATGSGLGLAIAERIVAAHQGRLTLASAPDAGTTVTITLPFDGVGVRWRRRR